MGLVLKVQGSQDVPQVSLLRWVRRPSNNTLHSLRSSFAQLAGLLAQYSWPEAEAPEGPDPFQCGRGILRNLAELQALRCRVS